MREVIKDPLYDEAVKFVREVDYVSTSTIQRKFMIGYNRAARMIEDMELSKIIGPYQQGKGREVLAAK